MSKLRLILNDQLSLDLPTLKDVQPQDVILICEAKEEYTHVKHHQKKIVFQILALREFVRDLQKKGWNVRHIQLDDPQNIGSLEGEVHRLLKEATFEEVIMTAPNEWRLHKKFQALQKSIPLPLKVLEDTCFLCGIQEFQAFETKHKTRRMEFFYREMRKKYGILLELYGSPVGGQWNYDKENRSPPRSGMMFPERLQHKNSQDYEKVVRLVESHFSDHFGDIEPFDLATTRSQALEELDHFIKFYLPQFGLYQDAMLEGQAYLYHSRISPYLNIGLLAPLEVCLKAEGAYRQGLAPLNSVEGFIRQILGWREYVRGLYWAHMPEYANMNYLKAEQKLPDFYWTGQTDMNCLREAISQTRQHAYSHHIQRLMVTGNFALIAGLNPIEVCEWYLVVYADAYDWVELPNTLGMALFGDGGIMGSKPYAASGKYIHRMSNFCENCKYDPNEMTGEKACPFNSLYWDFMGRNEELLKRNPRLKFMYAAWAKMSTDKRKAIRKQAANFLNSVAMKSEGSY